MSCYRQVIKMKELEQKQVAESQKIRLRAGSIARKLGKALTGAALVAGLMFASPKPARADTIELMAGNKNVTIDLKASADIAKRLGVFIRARPSVDYAGAISAFGLADLTINLSGGLDAVGEVQLLGGRAVPRTGMQYFAKTKDFSLYALATIGLDSKPYVESLMVLRYTPALSKTLRLLAQVENVTDVGSGGHDFSTQRMRLGVEWKGWGAGAAADLTEIGNSPKHRDGTFGWNAGGVIWKKF
jgi:hypothetical protein